MLPRLGDYYVNWQKNADEPYPSAGGANDSQKTKREKSLGPHTSPLVSRPVENF